MAMKSQGNTERAGYKKKKNTISLILLKRAVYVRALSIFDKNFCLGHLHNILM